MRLFTHAESGQVTYTPLSLDITKHSRYILSTMLYTQKKNTLHPPLFNYHFSVSQGGGFVVIYQSRGGGGGGALDPPLGINSF